MSRTNRTVFLNGEYVPHEEAKIPVEDRGFLFSDALYEVVRIYNGVPFTLDRHVKRMEQGAQAVRLDYPYSLEDFEAIISELVKVNDMPESSAYIQVTRGAAPRQHLFPKDASPTVLVMLNPVSPKSREERLAGTTCITLPDYRYAFCAVKGTGLLPNILACQKANDAGAFEAILVRDGLVTEGTNTNVYMVKEGAVRTYPLVNILPGITRSVLKDIAGEDDISFLEEAFGVDQLYEADEVFVTGSVMEIMPITAVDGRQIGDGTAGPVTQKLIDLYARRVERDCGRYSQT